MSAVVQLFSALLYVFVHLFDGISKLSVIFHTYCVLHMCYILFRFNDKLIQKKLIAGVFTLVEPPITKTVQVRRKTCACVCVLNHSPIINNGTHKHKRQKTIS